MALSRYIREHKYAIFKTLSAYLSYFCLGSAITLLGSSLLDLQIRLNVDFAKVSYIIPMRSFGHIVGSAIAGLVDQKVSQLLILSVINLVSGIFIAIAAFFTKFEYAAACLLITGLAQGMGDICVNTLLTNVWKEKSTNWLQALHMSWGVGALLTPVICRPFLLPTLEEDGENEVSLDQTTLIEETTTTVDPIIKPIYTVNDVRIQYAFVIVGGIAMVTALPFTWAYWYERNSKTTISQSGKKNGTKVRQNWSTLKVYGAVTITALISHLIYALETCIGSLGASFSVKSDLHMDSKTGVLLATVFWSCFSFYRVIFIPLTFVISEIKLLISSLIICLVGLIITIPWANYNSSCIWTGFVLIGIGISPIFAASYGILGKHITITSAISSIIFVPAVIGESIHPGIAATLMAKNPITLLYYVGVLGVSFIALFVLLIIYCKLVFKAVNNTVSPAHLGLEEKLSVLSASHH